MYGSVEPIKSDEELIDVLTAISVVSMKLARKITMLAAMSQKRGAQNNGNKYSEKTCSEFEQHSKNPY